MAATSSSEAGGEMAMLLGKGVASALIAEFIAG